MSQTHHMVRPTPNNDKQSPPQKNNSLLNPILAPLEVYDSQFLQLDDEMKKKIELIDRQINPVQPSEKEKEKSHYSSVKVPRQKRDLKPRKKDISSNSLEMSKSLSDLKHDKSQQRLNMKQSESQIKKDYAHKLKEWQKQKEELSHKRQVLETYKQKLKDQKQEQIKRQQQEEAEFHRLQKKKQLQQKILQIQERRKRRVEMIKNVPKRHKQPPKFVQNEQKFKAKEEQQAIIDLKLIRNKKQKMALDPQTLKAHEQAYIQRIKERLNMQPRKGPKSLTRQNQSDFNLYVKRTEEAKKAEQQKLGRIKKFQQKLNHMPIKIDEEKKKEVLISKDKAKNPRKYHILSQKSLNDQQIYQQFKGMDIELDPKKKGDDYLKELKVRDQKIKGVKVKPEERANRSMQIALPNADHRKQYKNRNSLPKIGKSASQGGTLISDPEKRPQRSSITPLEKAVNKGPPVPSVSAALEVRSEGMRPPKSRSFSQMSGSQSYERTLQKSKERDSRYINALRQKLVSFSQDPQPLGRKQMFTGPR